MWVRKKIEISPVEMLDGLFGCCLPANREQLLAEIGTAFAASQSFICLSIRSGFDLLLQVMNWPAGSEVIMSGLTIPDMPRIVRNHQLRPVGADIELDSLAPPVDALRALITPRTKAIVVAHLFGGRVDLEPICRLAREHNLMVIEDCAQAYVGNDYQGHSSADISMFSFGPIKTNTAVGGAVFAVRNQSLLQLLQQAHDRWPVNGRWSFAKRIFKYAFVRLISTWLVAGTIARVARWFGSDHDQLATRLARGFPGPRFFEKIRQQPSIPLVRLLAKKLQTFDPQTIEIRRRRGIEAAEALRGRVDVLGSQMIDPTYWVFPILVTNREPLVQELWRRGFDGTTRSSLVPVNRIIDDSGGYIAETTGTAAELPHSHFILRNLVFLPFDTSIPAAQIQKMVQLVLQRSPSRPERPVTKTNSLAAVGAVLERMP